MIAKLECVAWVVFSNFIGGLVLLGLRRHRNVFKRFATERFYDLPIASTFPHSFNLPILTPFLLSTFKQHYHFFQHHTCLPTLLISSTSNSSLNYTHFYSTSNPTHSPTTFPLQPSPPLPLYSSEQTAGGAIAPQLEPAFQGVFAHPPPPQPSRRPHPSHPGRCTQL